MDNYSVSALYEWFSSVKTIFIEKGAKIKFTDTGHGSASVSVETKSYLMEVLVWDYASCLDSQIMEVASGNISYPHTGQCGSREEFEFQLQEFLASFKKIYAN
jgi:hypothetical protein